MREDAQDEFRNPASNWLPPGAKRTGTQRWLPQEPIVRAEWDGNKYDVPRSWAKRRRRPWLGLSLLALLGVYLLAIFVLLPLLLTGRLG